MKSLICGPQPLEFFIEDVWEKEARCHLFWPLCVVFEGKHLSNILEGEIDLGEASVGHGPVGDV